MDHSSWPEFLIVKFGDFHHEGLALLEHPQKSKTVVENRELRPSLSSILQSFLEWILTTNCFLIDPSRAEAHLDDIRFNSNWVFSPMMIVWREIFNFRSVWKFPNLALLKALYSILKMASWVGQKKDNIGKYLRWAEKIPKFFLA